MPLPRKAVGVSHAGLQRQAAQEGADRRQVRDAGKTHRVRRVVVLEQHVDERTAFEVGAPEPLVEDLEDCQQPLARRPTAAFDFGLQPAACPEFLAAAQEGQCKEVF